MQEFAIRNEEGQWLGSDLHDNSSWCWKDAGSPKVHRSSSRGFMAGHLDYMKDSNLDPMIQSATVEVYNG